ncbi:DUF447 domain-containing protein [Hyperthermus butylicus]|uniref:Uncharacterized protein n=1 Tax=Hyperthermus butylicus (strain DSM 5456 / JCM 9403 / PLM1-5) TaxID=415426 RepID=A2BLD7_HYPBU|nr:DUF447 domain-containing protein [Hyperthermus butylicus]ABM80798.1 hypothetical protein Hbut_0950 [Hyperthermus butylicus DSM 5456]
MTPLGIYISDDRLAARLYPGTQLREEGETFYEACISFPVTPHPFYEAILGPPPPLQPSKSLHVPCIAYPGIHVEAVVTARHRVEPGFLIVYFDPVHVRIDGEAVHAYSRSYGCSIELLIALTRLRYWARTRPPSCHTVRKLLHVALDAYNCIVHATWSSKLHSHAAKALREAVVRAYETGCIAPSEVEEP